MSWTSLFGLALGHTWSGGVVCGQGWPGSCYWSTDSHCPGGGGGVVCYWYREAGGGVREALATPCVLDYSWCGGGGELYGGGLRNSRGSCYGGMGGLQS